MIAVLSIDLVTVSSVSIILFVNHEKCILTVDKIIFILSDRTSRVSRIYLAATTINADD